MSTNEIKANAENTIDIAVLQEQMKSVVKELDNIKSALDIVLAELSAFNSTIKTGKWIVVSVLLAIGALGHKGIVWASNFLSGN